MDRFNDDRQLGVALCASGNKRATQECASIGNHPQARETGKKKAKES
jgi:hypothetical protein